MTQPIKCPNCDALFGIEQPDGSLAIKYRDLFRQVRGSVSGPCRKCGATVEWPSAPYVIPSGTRWTWAQPSPIYTCNCACTVCLSGTCCMFSNSSTFSVDHVTTTNEVPE